MRSDSPTSISMVPLLFITPTGSVPEISCGHVRKHACVKRAPLSTVLETYTRALQGMDVSRLVVF